MKRTDKFNDMISSIQCDFSLAKDGTRKLAELDTKIENKEPRIMKEIKFRVWDKRNNRMIKPKKFATIIPVLDFNGNLGVMDTYKNWHWHGIVPEDECQLPHPIEGGACKSSS